MKAGAPSKWAGIRGQGSGIGDLDRGDLPTGVIVGTAIISDCTRAPHNGHYEWHLADVKRLEEPLQPTGYPQPVWFKPF